MRPDLQPLFSPDGVAVVGASRDGAKLGAAVARSLTRFPGRSVLVNARNPEPERGLYHSVAEAVRRSGAGVDLAVLCVPAAACAAALAEAAAAGVRAALVCAGGFGEAGAEGAVHERHLRRVVAETGVRMLGPNTSGFLAPHLGLAASFVPGAVDVPAGSVALVAASGGVSHALAFDLAAAGNGLSLAVGIGAGVDVTAADVLDHLVDDSLTTAVALHLESVPDGPRLVAAVRRVSAVKPVVALVVGRSDVGEFARSHTGALATSWRTTRAVLRQAGAVVVDDERELVDAVTALSRVRLRSLPDPGVGIVTAQAGPGLLLADRVGADGTRIPGLGREALTRVNQLLPPLTYRRNPVDTGRPGETFPQVLGAVAGDPGIDLVAVYALIEPGRVDLVAAVREAELAGAFPTVAALGGPAEDVAEQRARLHELGVPAVTSPVAAANAVRALTADARQRAVGGGDAPPAPPARLAPGPVDEHAAKSFLDALGVGTPRRRVCDSPEQARQILDEFGGPVAVKILDAAVLHKTDVGGVHLDVRTAGEMDAAVRALRSVGAQRFLVEEMAPRGVDLVLGARRDPVFGPIVLVGLGGTAAEALADVTIRLAPLPQAEAATMPDDLSGRRLLQGWRGGPVLDRAEFGRVVAAVASALAGDPSLALIEINPLRLTVDGLIALDAVVTRTEDGEYAQTHQ